MNNEKNYFDILGISNDSTNDEIYNAIKEFDQSIDKEKDGHKKSSLTRMYNALSRWYSSRFKETVSILDSEKTCEILGINSATDEELIGLVRYIKNGVFSTKARRDKLLQAIIESDDIKINKLLVQENDDEYTYNQIMAIYNYILYENTKTKVSHVSIEQKLKDNNCIETITIEKQLSELNKSSRIR